MKTILTVIKKEFHRVFKDRRLFLSLLLPGVLIFCIYSLLGDVIADFSSPSAEKTYTVAFANLSSPYEEIIEATERIEIMRISPDEQSENDAKERLADGEIDAIFVLPEHIDNNVSANPPAIRAYYLSAETNSAEAYALLYGVFSSTQLLQANFTVIAEDVSSEKESTGMILSMIAPLLLIVFLFTGCLSLVPESVAGEKERGSFATMLVTPVKRSHVAIGKIVSLSVVSLISGACSFLGLVLSLPKMLQAEGGGLNFSAAAYAFSDYLSLFFIVVSTVLIITALLSVLSTLAKSVKEANSYCGPLMLIIAVIAMANMFLGEKAGAWAYFIPFFNSVKAMSDVFSFSFSAWAIVATTLTNFVFAALLAFVLAKMFDSEKIVAGT